MIYDYRVTFARLRLRSIAWNQTIPTRVARYRKNARLLHVGDGVESIGNFVSRNQVQKLFGHGTYDGGADIAAYQGSGGHD